MNYTTFSSNIVTTVLTFTLWQITCKCLATLSNYYSIQFPFKQNLPIKPFIFANGTNF